MDTRRLRYFAQIVDSGSVTRAAAEIGLAQPALSQQLAVLEAELGVRLLDRSATGVTATAAGMKLYRQAQVILARVAGLREAVRATAEGLAGPVLIGMPPSLSESLALPLLRRVTQEAPCVRLQLVEEGGALLEQMLRTGHLEIAVTPRRPGDGALRAELLFTETLVILAPCDWDLPAPDDLAALAQLPWVTTRRSHSARVLVEALFAQAGLEQRVVAEIDSLALVIRAVESGLAAAVVPESVAKIAVTRGAVREAPFGPQPLVRPMFLCVPAEETLNTAGQFVLTTVRQLARERP